MSAGKLVPGFEDNQLMWTDSEAEVVISMPIKPEVLRLSLIHISEPTRPY